MLKQESKFHVDKSGPTVNDLHPLNISLQYLRFWVSIDPIVFISLEFESMVALANILAVFTKLDVVFQLLKSIPLFDKLQLLNISINGLTFFTFQPLMPEKSVTFIAPLNNEFI